jgi:hypothetical protein
VAKKEGGDHRKVNKERGNVTGGERERERNRERETETDREREGRAEERKERARNEGRQGRKARRPFAAHFPEGFPLLLVALLGAAHGYCEDGRTEEKKKHRKMAFTVCWVNEERREGIRPIIGEGGGGGGGGGHQRQ